MIDPELIKKPMTDIEYKLYELAQEIIADVGLCEESTIFHSIESNKYLVTLSIMDKEKAMQY